MKTKNQTLSFVLLLLVSASIWEIGVCDGLIGGIGSITGAQNSAEIESIGRFAIEEQNKKQNSVLEFVRVVDAKKQIVAGMRYLLTVEAVQSGKKKLYAAKVLVKPWSNSKQLEDFSPLLLHVPAHGN